MPDFDPELYDKIARQWAEKILQSRRVLGVPRDLLAEDDAERFAKRQTAKVRTMARSALDLLRRRSDATAVDADTDREQLAELSAAIQRHVIAAAELQVNADTQSLGELFDT